MSEPIHVDVLHSVTQDFNSGNIALPTYVTLHQKQPWKDENIYLVYTKMFCHFNDTTEIFLW